MSDEINQGVESKIIMANEFRQHLFRSLDIKTSISKDRIMGVNLLLKDVNSEEGLRLFKRSYKNESPFLVLVREGLNKTSDYLNESSSWISEKSQNTELLKNIVKLINFNNVFIDVFDKSQVRFDKQKLFFESPSDDLLRDFMFSWSQEVKDMHELLLIFDEAKIVHSYFKDFGADLRLALRTSFNSDKFNSITSSWGISFESSDEFMTYFSYCSLLSSISFMFLTFFELEFKIKDVNLETLNSVGVNL